MDEVILAQPDTASQGVMLTPGPSLTRHVFRGRAAVIEKAGEAFGVALPRAACRAAAHGDRSALWLGPDEYLLLSPAGSGEALEMAFAEALGGAAYALVDVSHRQVGLTVAGPDAVALLNAECPLDLRPAAFPVGMCTRTLFGKAEIVLWRQAQSAFYLEYWRSFAAYVLELARLIASERSAPS
jgi:sarcosine oxidase subunit gamma